jgi:hypothetical protein
MNANLKLHLNKVNQLMKAQADTKRTDRSFGAGDLVFLKLQPYAETSVSNRLNHKVSFRYFGPYKVIKRLSAVAYELELPSRASSSSFPCLPTQACDSSQASGIDFFTYCC